MTKTHPEWMTEEALHTLSSGYLLPGETPRDMMMRLASTAAKINQDPTLEEDLFYCLWNGFIGPASPVCSNFGTNRGLPISCYSVHLSDSVSSVYSHLKEVAALSKNGGGVGVYLGDVRPCWRSHFRGRSVNGGSSLGPTIRFVCFALFHRVVFVAGHLRCIFRYHTQTFRSFYAQRITLKATLGS
jgi:ribonucleotide reductase alpha subunit